MDGPGAGPGCWVPGDKSATTRRAKAIGSSKENETYVSKQTQSSTYRKKPSKFVKIDSS